LLSRGLLIFVAFGKISEEPFLQLSFESSLYWKAVKMSMKSILYTIGFGLFIPVVPCYARSLLELKRDHVDTIVVGGISVPNPHYPHWTVALPTELTINTDPEAQPDLVADGFLLRMHEPWLHTLAPLKISHIRYEHVGEGIPTSPDAYWSVKKLISILPPDGTFTYTSFFVSFYPRPDAKMPGGYRHGFTDMVGAVLFQTEHGEGGLEHVLSHRGKDGEASQGQGFIRKKPFLIEPFGKDSAFFLGSHPQLAEGSILGSYKKLYEEAGLIQIQFAIEQLLSPAGSTYALTVRGKKK
jgi:hypothetical protein